jgi:hypothetical protein
MIFLTSALITHGQDNPYVASCRNLEGKDSEPTNAVLPSAGKSPRGINKPANVHGESSVDRVQNCQFGKSLHHEVARTIVSLLSQRTHRSGCIHHDTYRKHISPVHGNCIFLHSPIMIKPIITAPGPPVWKALAVETKRPAPIAPPLE